MAKHEYRILSRSTEGDLADVVEGFLNAGWQTVGGMCIHTEKEFVEVQGYIPTEEEITKFYQAILRTTHAPSMGKEVVMDHVSGEVVYSEN